MMAMVYDSLRVIDVPRKGDYDFSKDQLEDMAHKNYKLSKIIFGQYNDSSHLSIIQLVFGTRVKSPKNQAVQAQNDKLKEIDFDSSDTVKFISMRMESNGIGYNGIRLYADTRSLILDKTWMYSGEWTPLQQIPDGHQIVGLRTNNLVNDHYLTRLTFLLAEVETDKLTGEISFDEEEVYPTLDQFKEIVLTGKFHTLSGLNYKHNKDWGDLSGIQLQFEDD